MLEFHVNLIYYAEKNKGAYKYDLLKKNKIVLKCKKFNSEQDSIIITHSASHINDETKKYMDRYKINNTIVAGSSLKFLYLCENKAQVYPRLGPTYEWDICASNAILNEAGGSIKLLDGSLVSYNKENLLNPFFVATGCDTKDEV